MGENIFQGRRTMANTTDSRSKAQEQAGKANEAAGRAVEAGREAAGAVADKGREIAGEAVKAGQHAAQAVGNAADAAVGRVGEGISSLGHSVRSYGPDSGMMGTARDGVARGLEQGGRYLQQEGLSGVTDDLSGLIRQNPIPAMLVGVGVGYLIARLTSRS